MLDIAFRSPLVFVLERPMLILLQDPPGALDFHMTKWIRHGATNIAASHQNALDWRREHEQAGERRTQIAFLAQWAVDSRHRIFWLRRRTRVAQLNRAAKD